MTNDTLSLADEALGLVVGSLKFDRDDPLNAEVLQRVERAREALRTPTPAPEGETK